MYSRSSTLGYICVCIYWAILRVIQKPTTTILLVVDTHDHKHHNFRFSINLITRLNTFAFASYTCSDESEQRIKGSLTKDSKLSLQLTVPTKLPGQPSLEPKGWKPWIPRELRLLRTWGWKGFCWPWRNPCSAEAYGVDYSLPFFVDFKAEEIPAATWKNANRKSCVVVWSFCTTAIALGFWNMILNPVNYNRALPNDHLCISAIVASVLAGSKRPAGPPP